MPRAHSVCDVRESPKPRCHHSSGGSVPRSPQRKYPSIEQEWLACPGLWDNLTGMSPGAMGHRVGRSAGQRVGGCLRVTWAPVRHGLLPRALSWLYCSPWCSWNMRDSLAPQDLCTCCFPLECVLMQGLPLGNPAYPGCHGRGRQPTRAQWVTSER